MLKLPYKLRGLSLLAFVLLEVWFMEFNTLSAIFQLYRGGQFYWLRKPEYLEKTRDLS